MNVRGRRRATLRGRPGRYREVGSRPGRRWSLAAPIALVSATLLAVGYVTVREPASETPPAVHGDAGEERQTATAPPVTSGSPSPSPTPTPSSTEPTIPNVGTGDFLVAEGSSDRVGHGQLMRYTVEVESGLPYEGAEIADVVDATLADRRGWIADDERAFQRTSDTADVRVLLATPATTDKLCAPLETNGEASCRNGELVVINARRWAHGAEAYAGDLQSYRQYVINHEIGHALGHPHATCPGASERAPVMLQQTYGLDGCAANPWPNP